MRLRLLLAVGSFAIEMLGVMIAGEMPPDFPAAVEQFLCTWHLQ